MLHIGNYLGAIKQWVEMQDQVDQAIFCIVDLHAITVPQVPEQLKKNILCTAALYLACGIDPQKSIIFVQSSRPEHSELAWVLNCITPLGQLERMTQFKDKAEKITENSDLEIILKLDKEIKAGLLDYPVLMAADILLYNTTHVPVGEDQKQHVELTRDLAQRFNSRFGETFAIPEPVIKKESARIMGLDDPTKKMSKSATTSLNYIAMTDDPETIRNKFKKAVTDSGSEIKSGPGKPAITNLLNIYSEVSGLSVAEIEKKFEGKGYGDFKMALAEEVISFLTPIQERYSALLRDPAKLRAVLKEGSGKAAPLAEATLKEVYKNVGLGLNG